MCKLRKYVKYSYTFFKSCIFIIIERLKYHPQVTDKSVAFDLPYIDYHRYIYVLIRFFQQEGFTVYIKPYRKRVTRFLLDKYAKELITDKMIIWSIKTPKNAIQINSDNLSSDYFNPIKGHKIPMCQHPAMYHLGISDYRPPVSRKLAIYFAGDFREHLYTTISNRGYFNHPNRLETVKLWIDAALATKNNTNLIIIDNKVTNLPPKEYRSQLAQYTFFLALPGIHMPLSHNIIEALSLSTIPLLHQSYAELMSPPLEHLKTAYVYKEFNNLENTIQDVLLLPPTIVNNMQDNIVEYYSSNLTPKAVVDNLLKNKKRLKLIAEWNSIPNA